MTSRKVLSVRCFRGSTGLSCPGQKDTQGRETKRGRDNNVTKKHESIAQRERESLGFSV